MRSTRSLLTTLVAALPAPIAAGAASIEASTFAGTVTTENSVRIWDLKSTPYGREGSFEKSQETGRKPTEIAVKKRPSISLRSSSVPGAIVIAPLSLLPAIHTEGDRPIGSDSFW